MRGRIRTSWPVVGTICGVAQPALAQGKPAPRKRSELANGCRGKEFPNGQVSLGHERLGVRRAGGTQVAQVYANVLPHFSDTTGGLKNRCRSSRREWLTELPRPADTTPSSPEAALAKSARTKR